MQKLLLLFITLSFLLISFSYAKKNRKSKDKGGNDLLTVEIWLNVRGTGKGADPRDPAIAGTMDRKPDLIKKLPSFHTDLETINEEYYLARFRAYLVPKKSGKYEFWFIETDDGAELFLSTDENPQNKKSLIYTNDWSQNGEVGPSEVVSLKAGKKYYIELILKESYGQDQFSLGWRNVKKSQEYSYAPVPASELIPFEEKK